MQEFFSAHDKIEIVQFKYIYQHMSLLDKKYTSFTNKDCLTHLTYLNIFRFSL
jgi:Golgi nucleoside diphosphatase